MNSGGSGDAVKLSTRHHWKWSLLTAGVVSLVALLPQISLCLSRGSDWQGSYFLIQEDEVAYSAYINSLIEGRDRRNDPYTGREGGAEAPLAESLFSIQFVPAYAIALPARLLGLSASTAFILLFAFSAFASATAVYWLILAAINHPRHAAAGTLIVLFFGTLVASQGEMRSFLTDESGFNHFTFLRRYQPAAAFPLFFFFCFLLRRATDEGRERRASLLFAGGAAAALATLVFSYFYLWTTAVALLFSFALFCVALRPREWRRKLLLTAIVGLGAAAALAPYFLLIARRSATIDRVQVLTISHAPDLSRAPLLLGLFTLAALLAGLRFRLAERSDGAVSLTAALALTPLVVFNQQIITGRSLQPLHYEEYVVNYVALCALVLLLGHFTRRALSAGGEKSAAIVRWVSLAGALTLCWGLIEASGLAARRSAYARQRDDVMPAYARLTELHASDSSSRATNDRRNPRPIVLCTSLATGDNLPTAAPQAVLWSLYAASFSGASIEEHKERLYQYLYFVGATERELAAALAEGQFSVTAGLFGWERAIPALSATPRPITTGEAREEIISYARYANHFSRAEADKYPLAYVLTPTDAQPDFSRLDRWYQRSDGEQIGIYTVYRVRLRQDTR